MSDEIDLAQMVTEIERATLLAGHAHRRREAPAADGRCKVCGEEIEPARRLACPEARRCLACQSEIEEGR